MEEPSDKSEREQTPESIAVSESEGDATSDEYVEDDGKVKKKVIGGKRPTRRLSISSESESDREPAALILPQRRASTSQSVGSRRDSPSPKPAGRPKRKGSTAVHPPAKRKKSVNLGVADPTRKYCLGKLEEIICQIFVRYPYALNEEQNDETLKKPEELQSEEKDAVEVKAKEFAAELEQCMYDNESEHDKQGNQSAGSKYKERFRMLSFNLPKPDRIILHKRIASSHITPKELSLMSSTDLANEDMKQSIKIAEQEALAHSILQKTTAPRAKITHKGLQDIEDLNGETSGQRDRELQREQDEEEKRERERMARIKAAQAHGSVPPESPVTPQTPSWGGPPPLPLYAVQGNMSPTLGGPSSFPMRPPPHPLFVSSASDLQMPVENELNLADLINIDDDPLPQDEATVSEPAPTPFQEIPPLVSSANTPPTGPPALTPISTTGPSPFAASVPKPPDITTPTQTSFDLHSLWASSKAEPTTKETSPPILPVDPPKDPVDLDFGQAADDQDFDMFLDEKEEDKQDVAAAPPLQPASFSDLPPVWSGTVTMPLDSTINQETHVVARQMGGRALAADSPLWQTLFPSAQLRIDGRVPVPSSSQFLLQVRLNAAKELIAVAFSATPESQENFRTLSDFLVNKNRHGLVFPWGHQPKESAPGKELYIIPLSPSEPIPEYMELLDELRLPKQRDTQYLVGIWVLAKGKLAPPPTSTTPPSVSAAPPPAPSTLGQSSQTTSTNPPLNLSGLDLSALNLSGLSSLIPHLNNSAVAAELASLTPEQMQTMLQTLSATSAPPPPTLAPTVAPVAIPVHSMSPASQPWQTGVGAPPSYPPSHSHSPHSPPQPLGYGGPPPGRYDRYDRERRRSPPSWERDDRDYRGGYGRGSGRGSGRGRGRERGDRDYYPPRNQDSGWSGRRGRGGHA
ncbi:hypothetical protein JAAARDRAFT_520263 [Jaapia argillacea MUCL 33604]|uniref:TFIIS central domain-containing protein n=1 Tax=Jaapia argillacea MUCL 33604 TaxID=933084 RepID=A0A067Q6D3_9AGAM|nr:hypothetical protein JAAARDRAFT_520263 [Jaapia argillacea MUCL 33604]